MMMEIFYAIVTLVSAGVAVYLFAENRNLRQWVDKQNELLKATKADVLAWQAKVLAKTGNSPLGYEMRPKPPVAPPQTDTIMPTVLLRSQMEERYNRSEMPTANYRTVPTPDVINKARNILDNVE